MKEKINWLILLFVIFIAVAVSYFIFSADIRTYVTCKKPPEVCNVKLGSGQFILLSSYNSGIIRGGCFLKDIEYDGEYLQKTEPIIVKLPLDYIFGSSTTYHRFIPKKIGQTTANTTGTCDYSRTYVINIV